MSFERCKAIVFWTKNPKPILPYLHELDRRGIHYYFQFTLNDYGAKALSRMCRALRNGWRHFGSCRK